MLLRLVEPESAGFAAGMFVATLVMMEAGRWVGSRRRAKLQEGAGAGLGAVEAAIFTLLGLLIAFTFQGAAARFDGRRELIVGEANAIGTAWLRIDLLPEDAAPRMRTLFREYLDSRLATYQRIGDREAVRQELDRTAGLQASIWSLAVTSTRTGGPAAPSLLLPALNDMFDHATRRTMAVRMHPPAIVFWMLALLSCAASFMAGHGMSGSKIRSWVHVVSFAAILAITVFVILDMEFPRLGLIRVDDFDQVLVALRRSMD